MAPMRDPSRLETECVFAFPKGGRAIGRVGSQV